MPRLADTLARRLQRSWWRPRADALSLALTPLAAVYGGLAERLRRRAEPKRAGAVVVVVGNLVVGGAGKTPTTIALVPWLREAGWRVGIVSRGHGRRDGAVREVTRDSAAADVGDEPLLLHLRTGAPVVVGHDRVAAARALLAAHPQLTLVVSDDGLQHRALGRDVQIIVFDERGIGNGRLLPAGPLREPLPARWPPHTLVLYNAAQPSTPLPGWTATRRLAGVVPLADWWAGAPARPLSVLAGRRVHAAAGIADPERFFRMLEAQGLDIERLPLPDHASLDRLPWPVDAEVVLTEKDAVKLRPGDATARVWVAALDFEPDPAFRAALLAALPSP